MLPRARIVTAGAVVVGIVVGVIWYVRRSAHDEVHSVLATRAPVSAPTPATPTTARIASSPDYTSAGSNGPDGSDHIGSANAYPVNLDALRTRLPNNRYWALGAPTSDPMVARTRAALAERDNVAFGRIQAN